MKQATSKVTGVLTSAALAAAVTIALGWPSHVNAVGNDEQAAEQQAAVAKQEAAPENVALAQNEYKIGDLDVTATLEPSATNPGRQVIRLECNNPTDGRIDGTILVALTRTSGSGGERVMPTPKIAWRHNENVTVEPRATLIREVSLPKNVSAEVARIERLQKAASESDSVRYPNVYFGATAEALEPPTRVASKTKTPKRTNPIASVADAPDTTATTAIASQPAAPVAVPKAQSTVGSAASNATAASSSPALVQRKVSPQLAMSNAKIAVLPAQMNRDLGY